MPSGAYDPAGQIVAATDANGATTRYEYDNAGRLMLTTDPLGGTVTGTYDASRRLTDQLGRATTYAYDAAGQLVERVDGALRRRIGEGDTFAYIGRDPDRPDWVRQRFDLTGSEILRLEERSVPYEIVGRDQVAAVIGRP